MKEDECPINGGQNHRFFVFKTFETYEPKFLGNATGPLVYERVEYAIMSCNCAAVRKIRVQE